MADWEQKAQSVRDYRDASLAKVDPPLDFRNSDLPSSSKNLPKQLLTSREYEITECYNVSALLEKLRSRAFSAEEVTRAFLRRAAIAQYATNCLTELMWDEAIERAKYLDALSEPLGPLHGLPISVKEHQGMHIHNKDVNVGYVAWIGTKSPHSPLNRILFNAGCVFYARTNEPQTLQCVETNNNIYGRTLNPFNRDLTPGGSSGGEGALIGMRGSVLGVGGDVGGSVRVPAGHCGIYGFKPTATRLGTAGMTAAMGGNEAIKATYGPLTTDRSMLELFMNTVLETKPWRVDTSLDTQAWTPYTLDKPLKIAVMWSDGVVKPHPPIHRALQEVSEACEKAGMNVTSWRPKGHDQAWDIFVSCLYPDGGAAALAPLHEAGEPILPLVKWMTMEQPAAELRTIQEYWQCIMRRDAYRNFYASLWNDSARGDGQEVDVILCPVGPGVAPAHDTSRYWAYTSQWNLLDYPAVVFPVTTVDPMKDRNNEGYMATLAQDRYNRDLWNPDTFAGLPVGLQIVGRRGMDEKVLAALEAIERAMGRV